LVEYLRYSIIVKWGIYKVSRRFQKLIRKETDPYKRRELKLRKNIEEQLKMKKEEELMIEYYNEAVTQFGFLALFASTTTLSPIFCFITNCFEMKIKINSMCYYSRRNIAQGSNGIGAWLQI